MATAADKEKPGRSNSEHHSFFADNCFVRHRMSTNADEPPREDYSSVNCRTNEMADNQLWEIAAYVNCHMNERVCDLPKASAEA